jgi:Flp pilus assembly protein TadG
MCLVATYPIKANRSRGRDAKPWVCQQWQIAKLPERSNRTILGGSAMGLSTAFYRSRRESNRRGSALLLVALALVPLFAMIAFAVDYGRICVAKGELQRAADSAALAATQELQHGLRPGSKLTPEEAVIEARKAAKEYFELNGAVGATLTLRDADIQIGYLADANDPNAEFDTSDPASFNAVRILARRDAEVNGPIPMTFGRILGKQSQDAQASALASFVNRIAGFKPLPIEDPPHIPMMPFALDLETWQALLNGQASDQWSWDAEQEKLVPGSDGVLECNLYPQRGADDDDSRPGRGDKGASAKKSPAGDRGTVFIGTAEYNKSHFVRQILFGITMSDWAFHNGGLTFDENGEIRLQGKRSIDPSLGIPLATVRGETRIIPIFSKVDGHGEDTVYTIVAWAGVRILDVQLTGPDKRVLVQPAAVTTGGTVTGDMARSFYINSRVYLAK